jgi:hypothetical protein
LAAAEKIPLKRSIPFISVRDHHFFKLRVTVPSKEAESGRGDYLQEVLDVLYPAVHFRSPAPTPKLTVTVYANVFLAPQHESCNLSGWMLYGVEMLEQIQSGNYMDTFERERSARKKARIGQIARNLGLSAQSTNVRFFPFDASKWRLRRGARCGSPRNSSAE